MAMQYNELLTLCKAAYNAPKGAATAFSVNNETFSAAQVNEAVIKELNELACDYRTYRENKNTIFRLIEETIDEVLPPRLLNMWEQFAEVKQIAEEERAVFRVRVSDAAKQRAKAFVARAADAARYETFILDGYEFTVNTGAVGAAARIPFQDMVTGRWSFAEMIDLILEGYDEWVYREIAAQLEQLIQDLPKANIAEANDFDEQLMDEVLAIADTYGNGPSQILCTFEFASKMLPVDAWVSDDMRNQRWNSGRLNAYKGHSIVILPQSLEDITNERKVVDPALAYVIPNGMEKPVKVVLEGQTYSQEVPYLDDWSRDMQWFRKIGLGVMLYNHQMCVYRNNSLKMETRSA